MDFFLRLSSFVLLFLFFVLAPLYVLVLVVLSYPNDYLCQQEQIRNFAKYARLNVIKMNTSKSY